MYGTCTKNQNVYRNSLPFELIKIICKHRKNAYHILNVSIHCCCFYINIKILKYLFYFFLIRSCCEVSSYCLLLIESYSYMYDRARVWSKWRPWQWLVSCSICRHCRCIDFVTVISTRNVTKQHFFHIFSFRFFLQILFMVYFDRFLLLFSVLFWFISVFVMF